LAIFCVKISSLLLLYFVPDRFVSLIIFPPFSGVEGRERENEQERNGKKKREKKAGFKTDRRGVGLKG